MFVWRFWGFTFAHFFLFLSDSGCQEHSVKGVSVTFVRAESGVGSGASSA